MARAIVLLMDSFGIGASLDADRYGDAGADTLGNIARYCAQVDDPVSHRRAQGPLRLPHLCRLGLGVAALASTGQRVPGLEYPEDFIGAVGYACEQSLGKDTPSGHWEIAGLPVHFDWGYFERKIPCFPETLTEALVKEGNIPGVIGNCHASGTEIIDRLGEEHMKTGCPIVYTSADSVFQIAAHEESFGLDRLYQLCAIARRLVDPYRIGRVIARPFLGTPGAFIRTGNRRDASTPPHAPTLMDVSQREGHETWAIGKTAEIFAHQGISKTLKAHGNEALWQQTFLALESAPEGSLIFTNFVDFDSLYGHRRDVLGYAAALETFDAVLPSFFSKLRDRDLVLITADHGCDPTFSGSDHTREHIPAIFYGKTLQSCFLGRRESFADLGQTLASHLQVPPLDYGVDVGLSWRPPS